MSDNTVNAALRRLGYNREEMTGHGFRSMASTLLNELGWNRDAIERQLAHGERDAVRAAYNFAEFLPERRKMMQAWADYLDELRTTNRGNRHGADVFPFLVKPASQIRIYHRPAELISFADLLLRWPSLGFSPSRFLLYCGRRTTYTGFICMSTKPNPSVFRKAPPPRNKSDAEALMIQLALHPPYTFRLRYEHLFLNFDILYFLRSEVEALEQALHIRNAPSRMTRLANAIPCMVPPEKTSGTLPP